MYFHVYLIYRFTRTFTDHSSVITRCWGFELQNGKSNLKSPQTLAAQDFAPASFLSTPDNLPFRHTSELGGIPEWPKGADCKSVVSDFGGSNSPSPTKKSDILWIPDFFAPFCCIQIKGSLSAAHVVAKRLGQKSETTQSWYDICFIVRSVKQSCLWTFARNQ